MNSDAIRGLWVAFAVLAAIVAGIFGGALSYLGGEHVANAVVGGAATFAATLTLEILVLGFLMEKSGSSQSDEP